jgi:hypothetical protein
VTDIRFEKVLNYETGNSNFQLYNEMIQGVKVIKQKILIRLNIYKGEWAADPGVGISMLAVSQNSQDPVTVAQIYADEILQVKGVTSVRVADLDVNESNRLINMTFTVSTIYNQTITVSTPVAGG